MEQLSHDPIQWNRLTIPELKGSLKYLRTKTLTGKDTMSYLLCPSLRLSYKPTKSYSKISHYSERQVPPSRKAIDKLTSMKITKLKQSPLRYSTPPIKKFDEDYMSSTYRLSLAKSQRWFSEESSQIDQQLGATRFSSRPYPVLKSDDKLIPARCWSVPKVLKTNALRFEEIIIKKEQELGNYLVRSDNVFRTEYLKSKNLKDRKMNPLNHPEFDPTHFAYHKRRDDEVNYREAFLRAKNMIKPDHK